MINPDKKIEYKKINKVFVVLVLLTLTFIFPIILNGAELNDKKKIINKSNVQKEEIQIIPSLGYKMVYIKPGSFIMGTPSTEDFVKGYYSDDEVQHKVTLTKGFYMGVVEITQIQWNKIMKEKEALFEECGGDCPIEGVSWDMVQKFINKLNETEKANKYRLPTEAEWEYACRAGTKERFFFGNDEKLIDEYAWHIGNSGKMPHPVGQKKPNAWGLYDMYGNVYEWCEDKCDWDKGQVITDTYKDGVINPLGKKGTYRIIRGGCWGGDPHSLRSAVRLADPHDIASNTVGFRLVMTE